jgi:tetratricopeptide (TPR) repeat protein
MDLNDIDSLEIYLGTHSNSKLVILLADLYLQAGNLREAVNHCRQEITQNPKSALAYYLLAQVAKKLKRQEDALEYLKQAIALDSGFVEAYYQLVEIGQEILPPGAVKSCYLKILELNPLDENAAQEARAIAGQPEPGFLKAITLPALPDVTEIAPEPAAEPDAEEVVEAAESEESAGITQESEVAMQQEENEPTTELDTEEPAEPQLLGEEEAHLGPVEPEEAEPEPEIELEQFKAAELSQAAAKPEPLPEEVEEIPETTEPEAPSLGGSTLKLSEMFNKMKSKPLSELQQENWSFPMADQNRSEQPKPEEKVTGQPKSGEKVPPAAETKTEPPPETAAIPGQKTARAAGKSTLPITEAKPEITGENHGEIESGKAELKIPVPTFTLVEVFKKQKLYNEALQLLDLLEKRSKNQDKIAKARQEIQELKLKEELE